MKMRNEKRGFALISTLSIVVLLALIAVGLLSLSSLSLRQGKTQDQETARDNAKLGLMEALNALQHTMGPDQRVSAPANILTGANEPADGAKHWVGVWNTAGEGYTSNYEKYAPSAPNNKVFNRWLVSHTTPLIENTDAAGWVTGSNTVTIFNGDIPANNVNVGTIPVGSDGAYAYWISDHSTKASIHWNEGTYSAAEADLAQSARLSSAPGTDLAVFNGTGSPLSSGGALTYPLKKTTDYVKNLEKTTSINELPLANKQSAVDYSDWVKEIRHDVSSQSLGVIADNKNGGLRRDLSLAFEMDGAAEAEDATNFNAQIGEFVGDPTGSGDTLDAAEDIPGHTTPGSELRDRYLFRDLNTETQVFSADITPTDNVVRGPSWHLMRDYANLYKSVTTTGSLEARAYYPNRTYSNGASVIEDLIELHADNQHQTNTYGVIKGSPINKEYNTSGTQHFHRPTKANYAPVLLGVNAIYSLVYKSGKIQITV